MVDTEPAAVAEPVEPIARHWHRPAHFSEPYFEFGRLVVTPYCECGEPLSPRAASIARRA